MAPIMPPRWGSRTRRTPRLQRCRPAGAEANCHKSRRCGIFVEPHPSGLPELRRCDIAGTRSPRWGSRTRRTPRLQRCRPAGAEANCHERRRCGSFVEPHPSGLPELRRCGRDRTRSRRLGSETQRSPRLQRCRPAGALQPFSSSALQPSNPRPPQRDARLGFRSRHTASRALRA